MKKLVIEEQNNLNMNIQKIDRIVQELQGGIQKSKEHGLSNYIGLQSNSGRIERYREAKNDPYFGRLDFIDQYGKELCYIGNTAVADENYQDIIYDWRSAFADAFYGFSGGDTGHVVVENENGDKNEIQILRTRRIKIKEQKVESCSEYLNAEAMKESGQEEQYSDEYLLEILRQHSSNYQIRDIVSSIQKEQNAIIRAGIEQPIVIQGVAGSGKSTVALHRVSYLLYKYRNVLKPENVLILAPNKMFLSSLRDVLPHLEIEKVQQHTFSTLVNELLVSKIPTTVRANSIYEDGKKEFRFIQQFKGSLQFREVLDQYVQFIVEEDLTNKIYDIAAESIFMDRQQLIARYNDLSYLHFSERKEQFVKSVERWLDEKKEERMEQLEQEFAAAVHAFAHAFHEGEHDRKQLYSLLELAHKRRRSRLESICLMEKKKLQKMWGTVNVFSLYKDLFKPDIWERFNIDTALAQEMESSLRDGLTESDVNALFYMECKLHGVPKKFDYVVVDEAQDLSPLQVSIINELSKSMTLLGDVTQSIYSPPGITDWNEIIGPVLEQEQTQYLKMDISYRSTTEIMEVANIVIDNSSLPYNKVVPVGRTGLPVQATEVKDGGELLHNIMQSVKELAHKYNTVAIIHTGLHRATGLYNHLKSQKGMPELQLISDGNELMQKKVVVIPAHLCKGLEFDAVIIPNASSTNYEDNDMYTKLLYVAVTRAQHELQIYYHEELTPHLRGVKTSSAELQRDEYADIL